MTFKDFGAPAWIHTKQAVTKVRDRWRPVERPVRLARRQRRPRATLPPPDFGSGDVAVSASVGSRAALTNCQLVTLTDSHTQALENQFGLADRVVDGDALAEQRGAVPRAGISAADVRPARRSVDVRPRGLVGDADPQGADARNLWRVHWYNDLAGDRVAVPDHVVLPTRA